MELFAILLSGLIAIISPATFGGEAIITQQLKRQFVSVENLAVRIDNTPSYQVLQGRIDQIRIAGRGLFPIADVRIDTLEVETDPIALKGLQAKLAKPLQAGVKLVITEADINRALASPSIIAQLKQLSNSAFGAQTADQIARYTLINPQLTFLDQQRLRLEVELQERGYQDTLKLTVETALTIASGRTVQLTDTSISVNGTPMQPTIQRILVARLNQQLDLSQLEQFGITARILSLDLKQQQVNLTTFVQVRPEAQRLLNRK